MASDYQEPNYIHYLCFLRSAPGMWTFYAGSVEVTALDTDTDDDIFQKAVTILARSSFPDRPGLSSWVFERIERV